ncbi:DUF2273 domain-containing protein [Anaeroselena agilis]|uniref:DUF2273 domain-containing protein n=1 Tax=Anaeroselena agilis TaxID=3063788 RepID=A0ABU3NXU9_9FIRM|nr:DUF2273 domain-containing protein [Selenomonadales bacterium 4137-cl]
MDRKLIEEIWQHHSGKVVGSTIGFALGVLIIIFGFFQTIFVLLCVTAGYIVGKRIDEKEDIMDILDKLLPPGYHR